MFSLNSLLGYITLQRNARPGHFQSSYIEINHFISKNKLSTYDFMHWKDLMWRHRSGLAVFSQSIIQLNQTESRAKLG